MGTDKTKDRAVALVLDNSQFYGILEEGTCIETRELGFCEATLAVPAGTKQVGDRVRGFLQEEAFVFFDDLFTGSMNHWIYVKPDDYTDLKTVRYRVTVKLEEIAERIDK